ncbi:glycosyltransferase [Chromohalobacter canadensis]|uniref:Glycosyltransferase n=1 Tax=Chromohalobacter canadensis TaxID=141389 RepID=A0ABZ0YAP7_9GAMM|nr:glycosyltransferase [Chromohalobacter canadensis]MCK0770240.1 glycosyltransferase [Chromohalobacter canadensis]WQH08918.1 glycosyltransferase [Chromohalobacter canadensis]
MSYLKKGNSAFRNQQLKEAVNLYEKAAEENPAVSFFSDFNIKLARRKIASTSFSFPSKRELVSTNEVLGQNLVNNIEYYSKNHPAAPYLLNHQLYTVDIVIPVYNALEDVKRCLESVVKHTDNFRITTYIVDDASEENTTAFLRSFCKQHKGFELIEHKKNCGYTKTVNDGLKASKSDYVVTLNSDAIVTKGWLQGLVRCMRTGDRLGIVGPLSNAASWQNVPALYDKNNQFAVNELPHDMTPNDMAELVLKVSNHLYPRVPFVNGFCFIITKEVIEKIGYLDEATFPTGYGEENDYCLRAAQAGFELAIADDTYVFHAKSKSFGHEKRKEYSKKGSASLKAKHGDEKVNSLAGQIRDMKVFQNIRDKVENGLAFRNTCKEYSDPLQKRVLFLLPVSGGGGGVHSIVQETIGMRRIGVKANIAVPQKHRHKFLKVYEDVEDREDIFLGFEDTDLIDISGGYDVIIGTIYTSMKLVEKISQVNKEIIPAYYIQDYEPLFSEPGSNSWKEAYDSYKLLPHAILFAKTDWICEKIFDVHGVKVKKVSPSIDHDIYHPDVSAKAKAGLSDKLVMSAMIRPKTPRRGAERTMQFLKNLFDEMNENIHIEIFGCEESDPRFQKLERDFTYHNYGVLTREGVASILKRSDYFVDFSDYQAFGRTGLEAMACGAAVMITKFGGVEEYAQDNSNCMLCDVFSEAYGRFDFNRLSSVMKKNAILTASEYSVHKASVTILNALA